MKTKLLSLALSLALIPAATSLASCGAQKKQVTAASTTEIAIPDSDETVTAPIFFSPAESESESAEPERPTETETTLPDKDTTQEEKPIQNSLRFISYGNGTCAVSGIGSCSDLCIVIPERSPAGDIVTTIAEKAFYGNQDIKAVEIPSTVTSIESMAFADCGSLVYISVDSANKSFADINGVLFSIDLNRLIAYPSACGAISVNIPASVKSIAPMAFFGCHLLENIVYDGTLHDWGRIDIGEMNYGLYTASLIYKQIDK